MHITLKHVYGYASGFTSDQLGEGMIARFATARHEHFLESGCLLGTS